MKIAIVYFSQSGRTKELAQAIEKGMKTVADIETVMIDISEAENIRETLEDCRGVVFGTPTYMTSISHQMMQFLQTMGSKLQLANKLGGGFATAQYTHGGGDIAISEILKVILDFGMMVYSGGSSFGVPYIHLGPVAYGTTKEDQEKYLPLGEAYGYRFATQCKRIFE